MPQGKIARLTDRGYGFISQEGEEKDLFFHANELQDVDFNDLEVGDEVSFEIAESPKGKNATQVSRAAEGSTEPAAAPVDEAAEESEPANVEEA